ncbi:hypothetical protein BJV82DRAFT_265916 [Fennellomyces sp. T-0311]|nr:hypothetical protein BJV82DRAFT_265916 [Fennellomyces sp. T-0311]
MKIPQLASLTATAALLLHFGSFVQANPMFVEIPPAHNDASETTCEVTRITYPAGEDIVFGNNTEHVVAWNAPSFASQVNLTLVGQNYVSYLKVLRKLTFFSARQRLNEIVVSKLPCLLL